MKITIKTWTSWEVARAATEAQGVVKRDPEGTLWAWQAGGKRVEVRRVT